MVCIYCASGTRVVNSRPMVRVNGVWRRRACLRCHAIFTSRELVDLAEAIRVGNNSSDGLKPFMRDRLFISIYESCRHRETASEDASALTQTVISRILRDESAAIVSTDDIRKAVLASLHAFDSAASTYYQAYYGKK